MLDKLGLRKYLYSEADITSPIMIEIVEFPTAKRDSLEIS